MSLELRAAGLGVRVCGLPPEIADRLAAAFALLAPDSSDAEVASWGAVEVTASTGGWAVSSPGGAMAEATTADHLVAVVASAVNGHLVTATPHLGVHAGVVAGPDGAVAFPAASGAGKSTLVAAGVRHGLRYVSDEALLVDRRDLAVVPYLKALGLDAWSRSAVGVGDDLPGELLVPPGHLGEAVDPRDRLPLRHVVVPRVTGGHPALRPLPRSQAVVALLANAFTSFHDAPGSFRACVRLARATRTWSLEYGDPAEAAAAVATLPVRTRGILLPHR